MVDSLSTFSVKLDTDLIYTTICCLTYAIFPIMK